MSVEKQAATVETLEKKRARLARLLEMQARKRRHFPLSFAQQRLFFLDQLEPGNTAYNIWTGARCRGTLDVATFAACLREVVRRHQSMRVRFTTVDDQPVQVVDTGVVPSLPVADLTALPRAEVEPEARRIATRFSAHPFDLARAPLFKTVLVRTSGDETVVFMVKHHIISDAWSLGILFWEIAVLYDAFASGKPSPLPELPIEYVDYVKWQQQLLESEALEVQLGYWKERLSGRMPVLELPTDRPRPAVQTFSGATAPLRLSPELTEGLRTSCKDRETTLFMTAMAAFQVLLHRHTGQEDVLVGAPVSGRRDPRTEGLIGFFVNTLVLRGDLSGDPFLADFLEQMKKEALQATAHQDLPFVRLVEELHPQRDLSRSPIFQVMLAIQNVPSRWLEVSGLTMEPFKVGITSAKFDLTLYMSESSEGMSGYAEYNRDLFDGTTIQRLLRRFETLLAEVVENPRRRLSELSPSTAGERHQLLAEWNATAAPALPTESWIVAAFEGQAAARPEAVALVFEDQALSYAALNLRANRLARTLCRLGVGPEIPVAISMERRLEMVVGLLGILKAGGAYVPLDPSYPHERLAFMLEDALSGVAAPVLLTSEGSPWPEGEPRIDAAGAVKVLRMGAGAAWLRRENGDDLGLAVDPHQLAYVIYTSGSTGRPKGVMNTHRAIANRIEWMQEVYGLGAGDRVLQKTPMSFDVSVWEYFWPLGQGAELVLARPEGHKESDYLIELIETRRITTLHFVPSMLRVFLEEAAPGSCPSLVRVVASGEALPRDLAEGFFERFAADLHNLYGPTEAAVDVSFHRCRRGAVSPVPIGRPIANVKLLVVDAGLGTVPFGAVGELVIGGIGLARGYRGREGLTASKFVADPFAREPGARLYRTGDLARLGRTGEIEYLGRIDHQVKLRGIRIELGEIEAVCGRHPGVGEVVVAVDEDRSGLERLVAHVVAASDPAPTADELRSFLHARLPDYMVPQMFHLLEEMPLSPNGKVDRAALARGVAKEMDRVAGKKTFVTPGTPREKWLARQWAELLGLERVGADDNFFDLGGHSLLLVRMRRRLQEELGIDLPMVELFRFPTVGGLARHLARFEGTRFDGARLEGGAPDDLQVASSAAARSALRQRKLLEPSVALIGMAGRFPGARDLGEFWLNLRDGVESITFFGPEELVAHGFDPQVVRDPRFVGAAALLDGPGDFDAEFFGMSPREAELMDPQHRHFLECAYEALDAAGYGAGGRGEVGVFAGTGISFYFLRNLALHPDVVSTVGLQQLLIGNDKDYLATRVSYKLNLRGPSVSVQTACSTSLVAVHMACESLLHGECDMALAGGVTIGSQRKRGYLYQDGGVLSADGHCRAFDAGGSGTIGGDGVGVVVLKRLDEALADGDPIQAVIRGTAVNNDGTDKVGFTAPSIEGQAAAIATAHEMAGIDPGTIGYVETHGTGTRLGDPIEVAALTRAFRRRTAERGSCALGSVKTNIGHTDAAAGVAGLLKTVLALRHGEVPPSLHFEKPNPEIDFASSPFYVAAERGPWPLESRPRRAGVSSFGMGGTNAHVVLEEAPAPVGSEPGRPCQLLLLSARTEAALERATERLARHLDERRDLDLADVAFTLQVGRQAFEHRRALVSGDVAEASRALAERDQSRVLTARSLPERPEIAFLFAGLGDHYAGMGRGLYEGEPYFRATVDECARLLTEELGADLRQMLYPRDGAGSAASGQGLDLRAMLGRSSGEAAAGGSDEWFDQTRLTQPLLFTVEYALARLWMSWGLEPRAMMGYSLGEYVAACLAGVLSLPDALTLVARRACLIHELPPGAMLAVSLPEEETVSRMGESLSLSAVNGPALSVVGGLPQAVEAFAEELAGEGVASRRLLTSHAFHSRMMEPIAGPLRELLGSIELREPEIPYLSNLTGDWIEASAVKEPEYWVEHLLRPVRFAEGASELWRNPARILLEIGPGQGLASLALQNLAEDSGAERLALTSLRNRYDEQPDQAFLLRTLGKLWLAGVRPDWTAFHGGARRCRISLPTYPFERRRFWIEPPDAAEPAVVRNPPEQWTYVPTWTSAPAARPAARGAAGKCWLVFLDECGLGRELAARLEAGGATVVTVRTGEPFAEEEAGRYRLDPSSAEDLAALIRALDDAGRRPGRIVHLGLVTAGGTDPETLENLGFFAVLDLVRAWCRGGEPPDVELTVVSNRMHAVGEDDVPEPEKALALGPVTVVPQELPSIRCRSIDLGEVGEGTVDRLLAELQGDAAEALVAHRGGRRFVRRFEPMPLEPAGDRPALLREEGVYWITGGLGGLGSVIARHLAETVRAKLVLTGRTPAEATPFRAELERLGAEVLVLEADVSDEAAMRRALAAAEERFGPVHGVVHAAGVPGSGVILRKSRELAAGVLAPKVKGTRVVTELFREAELDFLVLFSSLSALTGGLGEADYCAANAYLDAWAHSRPLGGRTATVSINWDGWREVGFGVEAEKRFRERGLEVSLMGHGLLPREGADLFARILGRPAPQIAVSTRDLATVVARSRRAATRIRRNLMESRERAERPEPTRSAFGTTYVPADDRVEERLSELWREQLGVGEVGVHDNFFEIGGHSLLLVQVQKRLVDVLGVDLPIAVLFQHPTIRSLADYLDRGREAPATALAETERRRRRYAAAPSGDVAILSMVGRFPGAHSVGEFWENLRAGVESITFLSDEELTAHGVPAEDLHDPDYVKAGGFLEDADLFDAGFFGLTPREAAVTDPQHRIFLECAYEALEAAGYGAADRRGPVGVFAGSSLSSYLAQVVMSPEAATLRGQAMISNDKFHLTTHVSYKLNLKGPSLTVETACSTALVAAHLACRSLLNGECEMALAGGVSIPVPLKKGYRYEAGGILSPDGHCRAFDAECAGTVFGRGLGVVLLKPLESAVAAGDPIHAVIKATAINNDGSLKVGYTAPSVEGQAAVIREAQERAGVDPATVGYVEAHATGTRLGDPIEVAALTQVFREKTDGKGFCALGSVKSNIGHLDVAAGAASLIKTALAVEHGEVPPSLHFETPNPEIDVDSSPFHVARRLQPWPLEAGPRRAGVSSFGFGGTNSHAVLEQAPPVDPGEPGRDWQLLVFSARSPDALERMTCSAAACFRDHPELEAEDVAYTLQVGRERFEHRCAVVCRGLEDAAAVLDGEGEAVARRLGRREKATRRPVAFVFPGQGSQHAGMGRELYEAEAVFREEVDRCCELAAPHLGAEADFRRWLLAPRDDREAAEELRRTALAQPALFAVEYSLARLWMSWGVVPRAMLGHSIGEYVAACLAGVFSLEDALSLVAARGRLMQELPPGAMLGVPLAAAETEALVDAEPDLALAAVNGPAACVVSGPAENVEELHRRLAADGIECRPLHTSHAFHSAAMDPILEPFAERVAAVERRPPRVPFLSNLTGTWITDDEATDPRYWSRHLRGTVRFAEDLAVLLEDSVIALLEVGPGSALSRLAKGQAAERVVVPSLGGVKDSGPELEALLRAAARLWLAGGEIDWAGFHAGRRRCRVRLPTYPFERRRYWVDSTPFERPAPRARKPLEEWTYVPVWKRRPVGLLPARDTVDPWLLFVADRGPGRSLADRLRREDRQVVTVEPGEQFARHGAHAFVLDPRAAEHYDRLFAALAEEELAPRSVVHCWTFTSAAGSRTEDELRDLGFFSLLHVAQALAAAGDLEKDPPPVELAVVTNGLFDVAGNEALEPGKATVAGPVMVIPQELSHVECRVIDLESSGEEGVAQLLFEELVRLSGDEFVAYRHRHRWVRTHQAELLPEPPPGETPPLLKPRGVYWITGGLGGLGLVTARYLARQVGARLVLSGRSSLPPRADWEALMASSALDDAAARRVRNVLELEREGAEVLVVEADVTDREAMARAARKARERFGAIDGVFHAAGLPGAGLIRLKTRAVAEQVLAPKVSGTEVIWDLFQEDGLGLLVLFSSLNSLHGSPGQVDYCGANAYLDAFAQSRAGRQGSKVLAVAWDTWQEVGMAVEAAKHFQSEEFRERFLSHGIRPQEGEEVLRRVLTSSLPQVAVSTRDLSTLLAGSRRLTSESLGNMLEKLRPEVTHPRPELDTPYVAPRNSLEQSLAGLWQELFGIDQIGIHDSFYDLGGHSLLSLQIASRVRETLGVVVPLDVMLERSTVAELAAAILERQAAPVDEGGLAELFKEIEQMSEEEARSMLTAEPIISTGPGENP